MINIVTLIPAYKTKYMRELLVGLAVQTRPPTRVRRWVSFGRDCRWRSTRGRGTHENFLHLFGSGWSVSRSLTPKGTMNGPHSSSGRVERWHPSRPSGAAHHHNETLR